MKQRLFRLLLLSFWILIYSTVTQAQSEKGIRLNTPEATPGYLLFDNDNRTYLVDNCGEIVHQWNNVSNTQLHPKLFENGDILFLTSNSINRADWDGEVTVLYENNMEDFIFHYELILLPNGNILTIGRRDLTVDEAIQYGWTSNDRPRQYDVIVEVDIDAQEIVWEWRVLDHSIQELRSNALNFGVVDDHPELLDINAISRFDWSTEAFMINGMDYNPELDQIALSMRKLSEIVIIDHSTTTEEAAGHTGGVHGKGGDILYRWGNPQNYGRGDESDRELSHQHNPNWIQYGEHKNKIMIFNNGLDRDVGYLDRYSSVDIIQPPVDENGDYFLDSTEAFGPAQVDWRYTDNTTSPPNFFSGYTSAARVLPNHHIMVTEGVANRVFELTPEKEIVWEYIVSPGNYVYRTEKYLIDFPAFDGRDLTPSGTVENPSSDYDCELISSTNEINLNFEVRISSNRINISNLASKPYKASIYSVDGRPVVSFESRDVNYTHTMNFIATGFYLIVIESQGHEQVSRFVIL